MCVDICQSNHEMDGVVCVKNTIKDTEIVQQIVVTKWISDKNKVIEDCNLQMQKAKECTLVCHKWKRYNKSCSIGFAFCVSKETR